MRLSSKSQYKDGRYSTKTDAFYSSVRLGAGSAGVSVLCEFDMCFFWRVRKIAKSDYHLRHVCQSVRVQQVGSRWTDFHEIC